MAQSRILSSLMLLSLSLLLAVAGCSPDMPRGSSFDEVEILHHGDVPNPPETPSGEYDGNIPVTQAIISTADVTDLMVTKASAYRKAACSAKTRNGAYVYSAMVTKYATNPEKLAARLVMLGFQDVYLSPGKSLITGAGSWLKKFIAQCHAYGLKVHALRIFDLALLVTPSSVDSEVSLVSTYNSRVAANERFDAITADLEPHTCHDANVPAGMKYVWNSETNYGIGKDNDCLLDITEQVLSRGAEKCSAAGMTLSECVNFNFQIYNEKGELSHGSTPSLLESCQFIIVMAYLANADSAWERSEHSLKSTQKPQSVSICLKTAVNDANSQSIQAKGWANLLSTVSLMQQKGAAYASFRGVDQFTYEGIETMWEWINDKN